MPRGWSAQIRTEEIERKSDCLGVDCVAVGAVRIATYGADEYTSHRGTGTKENKMARVRKQFQRRMRDRLAERLGTGGRRRYLVSTSRDDRDRDRHFAKAL